MSEKGIRRTKPSNYTSSMGLEHGKIPPNQTALEETILGAIMLESDHLMEVLAILRPEDFYRIEHQKIYEVIEKLYNAESKVDILTVTAECKKAGTLDLIGGAYYISQLTDRVASSAHAEEHAQYVKDAAIKRELIRLSGTVHSMAFEDTTDVEEVTDYLTDGLEEVLGIFSSHNGASNTETISAIQKNIEKAKEAGGVTGVTTGIKELDRVYRGRQKRDFIIKAARPAVGKTSQALSETLHIGIELDLPVLFFSLEMGRDALVLKLISMLSGVSLERMQKGELTKEHWDKFHEAGAKIGQSKIIIVDTVNDLNTIKAISTKQKTKHPDLAAIYVDYLQLVEVSNSNGGWSNKNDDVSKVSRGLKKIAMKLYVPLIALSQLSRDVEKRGGSKKPMLSDLRDSGSLEQDADIVEFLYRPEYHGIQQIDGFDSTRGLAFICIAKHRNGALKDVPMRWDYSKTQFTNWEETSGTTAAPNEPSIDDLGDDDDQVF